MNTVLEELTEDLNIHQKLDDEPNDVGGLTAQELKKKFDQAGLAIQEYLNKTHLPQVRSALTEALAEARDYADRKVVAVGAGDMAMRFYDTQGRREDVYDYARQAAREAAGTVERFGYVCAGTSDTQTTHESGWRTEPVDLTRYVDPKGLWDKDLQCITAPAGAKALVLYIQVKWARQKYGTCQVKAMVNGQYQMICPGPDFNDGKYYLETLVMPLTVAEGDKVTLFIQAGEANGVNENQAKVAVKSLRAEILL